MSKVLACGVAVLDVQQTVDRLPGPDEKLVANNLLVASGGPAANAAVTAAALGVSARLVTRIGDSPLGILISADLAAHGVDVVDCGGPMDEPAVSTVLVTRGTGQRAVISVNATQQRAARADSCPDAADWATGLIDGIDAVLVDGHHLDLALPLAEAARAAGVPVLLDGGSWKPGLERLLAFVDIALISAVLQVPADLAGSAGRPGDDVLATVRALGPPVVAASWKIAPGEEVGPTSKQLQVLVTRVGCNSGVTGNVEEPEIEVNSDRVIVTFVVTPGEPGSADCQGNPDVPFRLTLPEPLGSRALADGQCLTNDDVASTAFCADGGLRYEP